MSSFAWKHIILIAFILTLLNCFKPLHIDDTQYYAYAAHIAENPLDPYGFEFLWFQWPEPAMELLSPAFLPYWLAVGLKLFGDQPFLIKAWLFPFNFLFVLGIYTLLRRFVSSFEKHLTWLTVLSPSFLPSTNLMLDIPALALVLTALNIFIKACDRRSINIAITAGVVAGLAIQIKYSALIGPALILLYAFVFQRVRLGLVAANFAGLVFIAWEVILFIKYGQSHFLVQLGMEDIYKVKLPVAALAMPLLTYLGGVAANLPLFGFIALHKRKSSSYILYSFISVLILSCFAFLLFTSYEPMIFTFLGLMLWATTLMVIRELLRGNNTPGYKVSDKDKNRVDMFLVLWLLLEIVTYFAVSPFPATRRFFGMVLVITFLTGRLFVSRVDIQQRSKIVLPVAGLTILLGFGFFIVDLQEANASRQAAKQASQIIRSHDSNPIIWYVGHWGFQYYAEKEGMRAVIPDKSQLKKGDWLVVPIRSVTHQQIQVSQDYIKPVQELKVDDLLPLGTMHSFYGGPIPLMHRKSPRFQLGIYRITADVVPVTDLPPTEVILWSIQRSNKTAEAAVPVLIRIFKSENSELSQGAKYALRHIGVHALIKVLNDSHPAVRLWAAETLGSFGSKAKSTIPDLLRALNDDNKKVQHAAAKALEKIKLKQPNLQ